MGCGGSKPEPVDQPDDIDYRNVQDDDDDYPPPYIPERSRDDVYDPEVADSIQTNIDNRNVQDDDDDYPPPYIPERSRDDVYDPEVADSIQTNIDNIPSGTDSRYSTLLKHLSEGLTKEVQRVTAIYLWMKSQNYEDESLDTENPGDTPRGYMKMIKDGEGDLTTFFTILCRRSNIPCIILHGIGKNDRYFIGKPENKLKTKWVTVYADDEWRLVHVKWAIKGAKDGNQNDRNPEVSDFYFLTDPDKFAVLCSPDNFRWQLLNHCFSRREFMAFPNFRPPFFLLNGGLITPRTGTIKTSRSKTEIELSFPKNCMENMQIYFDYYFVEHLNKRGGNTEDEDKRNSKVPSKLGRYVFVDRKATKFVFEISLPAAGKYLFDVYGAVEDEDKQDKNKNKEPENSNKNENETGDDDKPENLEEDGEDSNSQDDKSNKKSPLDSLDKLCQFRLIAEIDPEPGDIEQNPDTPVNGWGPGPRCRALGLIPVSHLESCIYMKPGDTRELKFKMTKKLDVVCQLVHDYVPVYDLVEQVDCRTEGKNVTVNVQIPEEGRYALKIFCRETGTKEFEEACVYLVRQRIPTRLSESLGNRRKYRDKMLRKRLVYHIDNHTTEKELQDTLDVYECYNVPDQGEKGEAKLKLKEYWEVKRELNSAVKGRNQRVLRKWLGRAKRSKYEPDLQEDIQRAEVMYSKQARMKGYLHPIARMDQSTIIEIRNYKQPPKCIHDVMTSTYMLLGERKESLESWEQIQYLMGRDNIQKRILNRQPEDVEPDVAQEADVNIQDCSLEKCRETSTGIGAFYKWCKQFVHDKKQGNMDETDKDDENRSLAGRETYRDMLSRDHTQDSRHSNKDQDTHPFAIQEEGEGAQDESARDQDDYWGGRNREDEKPDYQSKQEPVSSFGV